MAIGVEVSFQGLTLHVKDVERSREFYERLPGVALQHHRPGQFALFLIGDVLLGLLQVGSGFHIELVTDDLDGLYADLRRRGIDPKGPPRKRSWGERTFIVADPDGNQIEFQ